ncbi:MAG: hypothetical protein WKF37_25405, partial [Bryobacteraceae bacterium]
MTKLPLALLLTSFAPAESRLTFKVTETSEVLAEVEMSSPGSDWATKGSEAAVAILRIKNKPDQQVMLFAGPQKFHY